MAGFEDSALALAMRDTMAKLVRQFVDRERPAVKYGRAISYNLYTGELMVLLPGDIDPIKVYASGIGPVKTDSNDGEGQGDLCRIAGKPGAYYLEDVHTGARLHSNPMMINPRQRGGTFFEKPVHDRFTKTFNRSLTVGETVQFFFVDIGKNLAIGDTGYMDIELRLTFFTSIAKRYRVVYTGAYSNNTDWYKLIPTETTGPYNADDFELEIKNTNSPRAIILRVRTTGYAGGFAGAGMEALIDIWGEHVRENVFNTSDVPEVTTEPVKVYGAGRDTVGKFTGIFGSPEMKEGDLLQRQLMFSGQTYWTNNSFKFVRALAVTGLTSIKRDGYFYIDMPTVGTVIPFFGKTGVSSVTVTSDGIPMTDGWDTLWYEPPWGAASGNSVNANFRMTRHTDRYNIPSDWIMLAQRCAVSPQAVVQLGSGDRLPIPTDIVLPSGWSPYGTPYPDTLQWRMAHDGVVFIDGLARNVSGASLGAGSTLFTMPAGARPFGRKVLACVSSTGGNRIDINTNGTVVLTTAMAVGSWVALDVSYMAGQ